MNLQKPLFLEAGNFANQLKKEGKRKEAYQFLKSFAFSVSNFYDLEILINNFSRQSVKTN